MTSMSGIKMDPSISTFFSQDLNLKKLHKYAGFKLSDDQKTVVIDEELKGEKAVTNDRESDKKYLDELKLKLKEDQPRYILYDFGFQGKDGRDVRKIVFLYWCSNNCPVKRRMIYASTKDDVRKCFTGVGIEFQINDIGDDMKYDDLADEILKRGF